MRRVKRTFAVAALCAAIGLLGAPMTASADIVFDENFAPGVEWEFFRVPDAMGDPVPGPAGDPFFKWGAPVYGTPGGLVSYSEIPGGTDCSFLGMGCMTVALGAFLPAGYPAELAAAFAAWSGAGDIEFVAVPDGGAPVNAPGPGFVGDIRIGGVGIDGPGSVLAFAFFPRPTDAVNSVRGDIFFDSGDMWEFVNDGTGDGVFNARVVGAHEIGHAIGLHHSEIMDALMFAFYQELATLLRADDIAGAVFIYGPQAPEPPVPEPATLLLFGSALTGLAYSRRRRR